jgi:HlyD family secretion protein
MAGIALLGAAFWVLRELPNHVSSPASALIIPPDSGPPRPLAAAPGRIEGAAESIVLGSGATGVVQDVLIRQGDSVAKGQLLVRIECDDLVAERLQHTAEKAAAAAVLERLNNGSRPEEIFVAEADMKLAEARLIEAEAAGKRLASLVPKGGATLAQSQVAERDAAMAAAQLRMSQYKLTLARIGPRLEEITEAKARVDAAEDVLRVTSARLAKCEIRSPIDGMVLRKHVSKGELVSIYNPAPIVTLAAIDRYRVRAEVDENDIEKVHLGQSAVVVLGSPSDRRLLGQVSEIGPSMGRRRIITTDAADKSDRDVLEVLVDLTTAPDALPIGLRVAVIFTDQH